MSLPHQDPEEPLPNADIYRLTVEAAWNQGRLEVLDQVVSPTYVAHDPTLRREPGPAGAKQMVRLFRNALPDLLCVVEDLVAEGDKVAARFRFAGTHQGDLLGIAPSGKRIALSGMTLIRFSAGKMVEEWVQWDALGLMRRLGAGVTPR